MKRDFIAKFNEKTKEVFAARLKALLIEHQILQKSLAAKAGITESSLSHYLSGDRIPSSATIIKLSRALNTSVEYLIGQDAGNKLSYDVSGIAMLITRNKKTMTQKERDMLLCLLLGIKYESAD